ncbi:MAG: hypothetical protein FJW27_04505 [Acidimicrobiia bacterium]|nr:hypothetical protein [Acidimicrobiia bacterium]
MDARNEQRFIAGSADVPSLRGGPFALWRQVAFLYHADFGMRALPTLPGTILSTCEAHAINERDPRPTGRAA